jgi:hypothetical protein
VVFIGVIKHGTTKTDRDIMALREQSSCLYSSVQCVAQIIGTRGQQFVFAIEVRIKGRSPEISCPLSRRRTDDDS